MTGTVETRDTSSLTSEKMLMTYSELSDAVSISRRKLERLVQSNQMPFVKIGRHVRFEKDAVTKWLKKFRS